MRGKVGSVAHHMKLSKVGGAIGDGESNRILIVNFYFVHFERQRGERSLDVPLPGVAKRAPYIDCTCDSGVSGELAAKIRAPENIEIELIHLE